MCTSTHNQYDTFVTERWLVTRYEGHSIEAGGIRSPTSVKVSVALVGADDMLQGT